MAMFSFDERFAPFDITPLENQFILNYLPDAPGDAVRVYIYGLMSCHHPDAENSLERMARDLHMEEADVRAAYRYWERKGLVCRVSDQPPQYRYVNVSQVCLLGTQMQVDPVYEAFAEAIYAVFGNERRLHGGEISQCYEWVEQMHLPVDVVIAMMKHMVKKHGKNVSMKTAQKMAVKLAEENIQDVETAEEYFKRDNKIWQGSRDVVRKLGQMRPPSEPEQTAYKKWLLEWHFTPEAILRACDESIKSINPTFAYIEGILKRLHEKENVSTAKEVEQTFQTQKDDVEPLKAVLRVLNQRGLTVNEMTVSAYQGFQALYSDAIILLAAKECAKRGTTTMDAIQQTLMSWKSAGLETQQEIEEFMREIDRQNEFLSVLYQVLGVDTKPNAADRKLVLRWMNEWHLSQTLILGCASWAVGRNNPLMYLNRILDNLQKQGIVTLEAANAEHENYQNKSQGTQEQQPRVKVVSEQQYTQRDYTHSEDALDAMMKQWQEEGGNA